MSAVAVECFAHEVVGPTIPVEQQYAKQRYFVRGVRSISAAKTTLSRAASTEVYRSADHDYAQLKIEAIQSANGVPVSAASAVVYLSPGNLRELAARLLDAAADLEAYPSASLLAVGLRQGQSGEF